jgi:hypothetical protein
VNDGGESRRREVQNRDDFGLEDDDRRHAVLVHRHSHTVGSFV